MKANKKTLPGATTRQGQKEVGIKKTMVLDSIWFILEAIFMPILNSQTFGTGSV
jgi:hypothetical protein